MGWNCEVSVLPRPLLLPFLLPSVHLSSCLVPIPALPGCHESGTGCLTGFLSVSCEQPCQHPRSHWPQSNTEKMGWLWPRSSRMLQHRDKEHYSKLNGELVTSMKGTGHPDAGVQDPSHPVELPLGSPTWAGLSLAFYLTKF